VFVSKIKTLISIKLTSEKKEIQIKSYARSDGTWERVTEAEMEK
jgi:hypothetical protein